MKCPYLKEARVKYCDKSAFRKMIRIPGDVAQETCSSPRYKDCAMYRRDADGSDEPRCPYLRESMAQYCSGASVAQFVPYTESLLSRCSNEAFRYCDTYLAAANPVAGLPSEHRRECSVGGMRMPNWLYYSANHLWLDITSEGACHIGIDAFLARVLGPVEHIAFLNEPGIHRPTAVLTTRGMDVQVVFPNPMLLIESNLYLRANPAKLTAGPYGAGWLFQGVQLPGQTPVTSGLIRGENIVPWIESEIGRMSDYLSECRFSRHGQRLANDGGVFGEDVLAWLSRDESLRLFHEFFSGWRG